MKIYVVLKRYFVILYAIQFKLSYFYVMQNILLHVIISVTDIQRVNYLRYNFQFNIWYHD